MYIAICLSSNCYKHGLLKRYFLLPISMLMNPLSLRFALCCFLFFMLLQNKATAQEVREPVPVNERDICFFYTEATHPGESNYKVVIFSSYLYRAPIKFGYNSPSGILSSSQFRIVLSEAFFKKCEKIMSDETTGYAYSSIHVGYPKDQWGYFDNTSARGPYELYNVISSTTSYLEQVREKIMADFRRRGYTILQTNFSTYFDESLKKAEVEQISKLSSLIIPEYSTGALNEYAKRFRNNSSSGGGLSLTVTSKEEKKDASGSNSSTTKKAEDPDKWKRQVEIDRVRSMDLEAEGDRLEKMGSAFAQSAYAKYKEAYTLYPSERVKQKMDGIAAYFVLAQGITKLGEGVANTIETLDPNKKTRHLLVEFRYAGLLASYKDFLNQNNQRPSITSVGILGHRTFLSFGVRFGYMVSPTVEYRVKNLRTGNIIGSTMRVQQSGGTGI